MRLYRFFLFATILVSIVWLPLAADAITLAELQQQAVVNRDIVEKYRIRVQQGSLYTGISRSYFWPSLDVYYETNTLDESSAYEYRRNSAARGSLSYNIFAGFRDKYNLEAAELTEISRGYELQSIIQDLYLAVAVRYLDIYTQQQNLQVADDAVSLLKSQVKDADFRYRVGLIRKNEVLKIEVNLNNAVQRREEVNAEYQKSINLLRFTTGVPLEGDQIAFLELDRLPDRKPSDDFHAKMLALRSEIKTLETIVQALNKKAEANRSAYYPSVDLIGSYNVYGDEYDLKDSEGQYRLQARLNMNLFDGFKKGNVLEHSQLDTRSAELDLSELKNLLSTRLDNALLDYEISQKNYELAQKSIGQAEENLRVNELAFDEGIVTSTETLDAIFLLSQAKLIIISARSNVFRYYLTVIRMIEGFDTSLVDARGKDISQLIQNLDDRPKQ